jgi:hypothetical protein
VLILVLIAGIAMSHSRLRWAEERAREAEARLRVSTETTHQLDRHTNTVTVVREKAQEAEREIQSAPSAATPLDPDLRATLCAGLGRVRDAEVCAG